MAAKLDRCTACDANLDLKLKHTLRKHPLLKTLICSNCYRTYNGGDFSRFIDPIDENGYDNYCRWCADGGTLISCDHSECRYAFCEDCITRNFGEEFFNEITSKRWYCFVCNPLQIKELMEFAKAAFKEEKPTPVETAKQFNDVSAKSFNDNLDVNRNINKTAEESQSKKDVSPNFEVPNQMNETIQKLNENLSEIKEIRDQMDIALKTSASESKDSTVSYYKESNPTANRVPQSIHDSNNNYNCVTARNDRCDGFENIRREMNNSDTCAKKSVSPTPASTTTSRLLFISGVALVASFVAYALLVGLNDVYYNMYFPDDY